MELLDACLEKNVRLVDYEVGEEEDVFPIPPDLTFDVTFIITLEHEN